MIEAWKAVVDGVQDARARAHMKQLSFGGMSFVSCLGRISVDKSFSCVFFVFTKLYIVGDTVLLIVLARDACGRS